MRLRVRYFASLADLTRTTGEGIELPDDASVADLWAVLAERHPDLGRLGYRPMVACDMTYATWDDPLRGIEEVAFLPPVSGG